MTKTVPSRLWAWKTSNWVKPQIRGGCLQLENRTGEAGTGEDKGCSRDGIREVQGPVLHPEGSQVEVCNSSVKMSHELGVQDQA